VTDSLRIAHVAADLAICFVLGSICMSTFRRSLKWVPVYGTLFVLHPVWTMDLRVGCGVFERFVSVGTSVVLAAILICQIFWPDFSRRRFVMILCLTAWMAYFSSIYLSEYSNLGWSEEGFVRRALASLLFAEGHLMEISPALTLICFFVWLWNRFHFRRFMESTRPRTEGSSRVGLRLVCAGLGCFFLSYPVLCVYRMFETGRVPRLIPGIIALGMASFLIASSLRGRLPVWDLPASRRA
jgi:hypothetical protein